MKTSIQTILAGLAAGVVVAAAAVPATAQIDALSVAFRAPTPAAGEAVAGSRTIRVEANSQTRGMIKDVTIRIQADNARDTGTCQAAETKQGLCLTKNFETGPAGSSEAGTSEVLNLDWDTNKATPLNGIYDVVAFARSDVVGVNDSQVTVLEDVKVNNAPDRPSNLSVSAPVRGQPELTVTWSKNTEGDITGYALSRALGEGDFEEIRYTGKDVASVEDSGIPFDTEVRYQLVAFRSSPVFVGRGIASSAATTSAVTIQAPPPPPSPSPSSTPGGVKASPKGPALKDLSGRLGSEPAPGKVVKPVSLAARESVTGPRRDGGSGFGRLLPFGMQPPQSFITEEFAESVGDAIRNPGKMISTQVRVNPTRFVAAAVLLLVTAGHLGRGAHSLFRSATKPTSSTSQPATA